MRIDVQLTEQPIPEGASAGNAGATGAWVEFRGVVRGEENGTSIIALEYEAYPDMALREMQRLLEELAEKHPCLSARVIHRVGLIPVGEAAIYVGISAQHRAEAFALLTAFMDRLKQDVPIWKTGARSVEFQSGANLSANGKGPNPTLLSLDEARALIQSRRFPLPPVSIPLSDVAGHVLAESVCAPEDMPATDKSTRDGYAIRADDGSTTFAVVDTLHAADWEPRELKAGEAVRVATGASLPGSGLRVVMQEHVERDGERIRIVTQEAVPNVRLRGEDVQRGRRLVPAGTRLNGGALALLASVGCVEPLVSPRLRVTHFTTGDEIVPPGQVPQPGQIRDSNSYLIRGLLKRWPCDVEQAHLPEDFQKAESAIEQRHSAIGQTNLLLVSGGASVGDKDFTRPLLEWLGYEIVFSQINLRPGRPLIFGVKGSSVAFGLPGNPLSHFVCFHAFVDMALAGMTGTAPQEFQKARLAESLAEAYCPRETLWPARLAWNGAGAELRPLRWASSGDVTCLADASALIRVPANCGRLAAGARVDFLPAGY